MISASSPFSDEDAAQGVGDCPPGLQRLEVVLGLQQQAGHQQGADAGVDLVGSAAQQLAVVRAGLGGDDPELGGQTVLQFGNLHADHGRALAAEQVGGCREGLRDVGLHGFERGTGEHADPQPVDTPVQAAGVLGHGPRRG